MWHASVACGSVLQGFEIADQVLAGRGSAVLGEWREVGRGAVHLRRRLTEDECLLAEQLVVRDIRGTPEEAKRLAVAYHEVPRLRDLPLR